MLLCFLRWPLFYMFSHFSCIQAFVSCKNGDAAEHNTAFTGAAMTCCSFLDRCCMLLSYHLRTYQFDRWDICHVVGECNKQPLCNTGHIVSCKKCRTFFLVEVAVYFVLLGYTVWWARRSFELRKRSGTSIKGDDCSINFKLC